MKAYAHYYKLYWRLLRMGRLGAAEYAHTLAHTAAIDPRAAAIQRLYDKLVLGV